MCRKSVSAAEGLTSGRGTHWPEPVQPPRVTRAWTCRWRMPVPERLRHRDHTGAKALLFAGRHGHQLADGLPGRCAERAQQRPVMHEVGAKELRDGEDPLGVADIRDHLVLQEGGELGGTLGAAGWAEPAPSTREGEQGLGGAIVWLAWWSAHRAAALLAPQGSRGEG